ncbi:MAG: sulfatase [Planctomycetales bacterium]|nr:sulfatase [Planctomycetales bacterium]
MAIILACSKLPSAAADDRPNILFAIADDASFAHFGAYGCRWVATPAFDRIAHEGLLFTRAYTPNAKCAPSRAAILTGRYSWQLAAAANHWCYFPTEFTTFPETLAQRGYAVGGTGKGWAPGIARDAQGKPRQLTGAMYQQRKTKPPTPAISPLDYAANFVDFLNDNHADSPWCFWYGGYEPHRGYARGSGERLGGKQLDQIDRVPTCWPDIPEIRSDLLDYAYEIEYFDQQLGRMLDELENRGQLDNTIVIVTADNGMPFPHVKGQCYELSNHLPLAIRWPQGITGGRRIESFVNFVDLAPTILTAAGVDPQSTPMAAIAGRPLTEFFQPLNDTESARIARERDHTIFGKERHDVGRPRDTGYPVRAIVTDRWLYLRNFEPSRWPAGNPSTGYLNCDGSPTKSWLIAHRADPSYQALWQASFGKRSSEELYDLSNDPDCLHNLAEQPQLATTRSELRTRLESELRQQRDPRMLGNGQQFDAYPYADLKTQAFYERYHAGESLQAGWVSTSDFDPDD